jgi:CheY-like chemotaxis protein
MTTSQKIKILLAEDDHDLREIITMHLLEIFPVVVDQASHGAEAIEKLKSNTYDLLISDYLMPIQDGKKILEFNLKHKNIPFIMMTASEVKNDELLSRLETFNSLNKLFMKPFSIENFSFHIGLIISELKKD